jgi:hypothetical protein
MEQQNNVIQPVRVKEEYVWQLAGAALILVVSIVGLILCLSSLSWAPAKGEEQGIGYMLASFALIFVNGIAVILMLLLCSFGWWIGMILSARLAFKKQDKPRLLWICSVILTAVFTTLVLAVLVYFGIIACAIFF